MRQLHFVGLWAVIQGPPLLGPRQKRLCQALHTHGDLSSPTSTFPQGLLLPKCSTRQICVAAWTRKVTECVGVLPLACARVRTRTAGMQHGAKLLPLSAPLTWDVECYTHLEAWHVCKTSQLLPGPLLQPVCSRVGDGSRVLQAPSQQEGPVLRVYKALCQCKTPISKQCLLWRMSCC